MDNYYKQFKFILNLVRAYDPTAAAAGAGAPDRPSKKRSRDEWETELTYTMFNGLFRILAHEGVFPTFRALTMESFLTTVSMNDHNEYYEQVMGAVVEFRYMVKQAEALYVADAQEDLYFFVADDMVNMLRRCKHSIILFQLAVR